MKIAVVLGTRPEIIKLSSIIRFLKDNRKKYILIHSNQHYSKEMDQIFFKDLDLPQPNYNLDIGSDSHAKQTAKILERIERIFEKEKPDIVLVQGDTNTVMAAALTASKMAIKVGHIEAGLRSYDRSMPEEINRIISDHISDYLFPPTKESARILLAEGIEKNKIHLVGNTVVDALFQGMEIAKKKSNILQRQNLKIEDYFLLTLHRPSNVDNKKNFKNILVGLEDIYKRYRKKLIFPIHPRTKKQMELFNLKLPLGVVQIEPIGYLDMIALEQSAELILTDSGGIQEEACILKTPCVTIRENTERPESIIVGANILAGNNPKRIVTSVEKMLKSKKNWKNPFGDGRSGEKIVKIITK